MKKSTHKRLTAWLLTLALVVTLLPGMGMTALAAEDGDESTGPPAVEVVAPEDESSGSDETVGTPPSTEPESKEEDKTTEGEGGSSGSDYNVGADAQPRGRTKAPTALAANYSRVSVNNVLLENGHYLESNSSTSAETGANTAPATYVAWYKSGVLTLKGYNGKGIEVQGVNPGDLTIKLIGDDNTIKAYTTGIQGNSNGGSITITTDSGSSGTLTINVTNSTQSVYGIDGVGSSVTITGSADVKIKATTTDANSNSYGIKSNAAVSILDSASVDIISKVTNGVRAGLCYGIHGENVTISTDGTIMIDVTEAGNDDADSYGVYFKSSTTLAKVKEMQVKWKKAVDSASYLGGAIRRDESFDTTTHAVNVDKTNCYASYRKGTPYQVTAGNGKLTGPGVPNKMGSGMFLKGDKVSITPNVKKSRGGEVIPFQKWTSSDVTITNPTTENNSFTVPARKVTVIAKHNPFVETPTFTPTGDLNNRGVLTFKTVVNPVVNEYFKLLEVGEEGSYISINPSTSSTSKPYVYTYEASSGHSSYYVAPGEYYVAEYLDGTYYLSEKFTVDYVKPRPEIHTDWWFDPTVFTSAEEGYAYAQARFITITNKGKADTGPLTITVEGTNPEAFTVSPDKISNIPAGGKAEPIVRPAKGLTAGEYYATLKIRGANVDTLSLNMKFIVTPKMTPIDRPTANTGLVYNGTEQIGVNESAGYTLTGTYKATDVGATSYTATATLNSNYKWSDGGTEDVTITWNIGKRDPKIEDFEITLPDNRTEWEMGELPYVTYDGNAKTATATLKAKYSGCGDITVKYKKFVSTGTYATLDEAVDAGTYDVLVYVAAGGSNFNAASALVYNTSFLIKPVPLSMPQLTVKAPTASGGMGKIVGTTTQMRYAPKGTTNWKSCSDGETSVMPGTYNLYLKADSTDTNHTDSSFAEVTVPAYGAGVTVSGTAVSWNNTNDALYYLYPSTTSDADIKAEWKSGGYTGTACTSKGTPTANGKQFEQTFTFDTVAAGNYKLVIVKPGHGLWIEELTVNTDNITDKSIRLYKMGDVNRDGKANSTDALWVRQSSVGGRVLDAYQKILADLNRDGKVNSTDALWIRQISVGSRTLTY